MLVFAAGSTVAIANAFSNEKLMVSGSVSIIAFCVVGSFLAVNQITLKKIVNAKKMVTTGIDDLDQLFEGDWKGKDLFWKRLIHILIMVGFTASYGIFVYSTD